MRRTLAALALAVLAALPAAANDRVTIGAGRLFTNDIIGDGKDRWRTGGYAYSFVRGPAWTGRLPSQPGRLLEFRFRNEIITPAALRNPPPGDRRFAGVLSAGVHTHFQRGAVQTSIGLDLVATGPMTGVDQFQSALHRAFGLTIPNIYAAQIGNGIHPTVTAEIARVFSHGPGYSARPFAEMTAGVETMVRVGFDILSGETTQRDLMLRDVATGHRYRVTGGGVEGYGFTLGADVARVYSSVYLPSSLGYQVKEVRGRIRSGIHWQGRRASVFYGVTYLTPEFEGQPEGQVLGALRLNFAF